VALLQSYARVGKFAMIKHQRYAHAKQFTRANKPLKTLRTYLGRVIRDIARKTEHNPWLKEVIFNSILSRARRVRDQQQHLRGPKVYSLHAPEVECIGKGKPHRPCEFGVKVSGRRHTATPRAESPTSRCYRAIPMTAIRCGP
jgi:transposase, IS5 family